MKTKTTIFVTSSVLVFSMIATALTVTKLKQNQSTAGPPVAASDLPTEAPNPNMTIVEGELIESFPEIPVYPSANLIKSGMEPKDDGAVFYTASWVASGDNVISEMSSWYADNLTKEGWTKVDEAGDGLLTKSQTFIRNTESMVLGIAKGDGKSRFRISILADILVR